MKVGYRNPNIKKSISSKTTGKIERSAKKVVTPGYGKKGVGYINDPKKAIYNNVYNKTTKNVFDELDEFDDINNNTQLNQDTTDNITIIIWAVFIIAFIIIMVLIWNFLNSIF